MYAAKAASFSKTTRDSVNFNAALNITALSHLGLEVLKGGRGVVAGR